MAFYLWKEAENTQKMGELWYRLSLKHSVTNTSKLPEGFALNLRYFLMGLI